MTALGFEVVGIRHAAVGPGGEVVDVARAGRPTTAWDDARRRHDTEPTPQGGRDAVGRAVEGEGDAGERVSQQSRPRGGFSGQSPGGVQIDRSVSIEQGGLVADAEEREGGNGDDDGCRAGRARVVAVACGLDVARGGSSGVGAGSGGLDVGAVAGGLEVGAVACGLDVARGGSSGVRADTGFPAAGGAGSPSPVDAMEAPTPLPTGATSRSAMMSARSCASVRSSSGAAAR